MTISEKLNLISNNMATIYGNGYANGYDKALYDYYDGFWDGFQQYGDRKNYDYCFSGRHWVNAIMTPKYDIAPTSASRMFLNCNYSGDLRKFPEGDFPVGIDFKNCTIMDNLFGYCFSIKHIGVIDMSSATSIAGAFVSCSALETIDEVKFAQSGNQTPGTSIFKGCTALKNIKVTGVIGDSISFADSKSLSRASIESIVNALSDTVTGKSLTFSHDAVGYAFSWDFAGAWTDFIGKKPNWTISLG